MLEIILDFIHGFISYLLIFNLFFYKFWLFFSHFLDFFSTIFVLYASFSSFFCHSRCLCSLRRSLVTMVIPSTLRFWSLCSFSNFFSISSKSFLFLSISSSCCWKVSLIRFLAFKVPFLLGDIFWFLSGHRIVYKIIISHYSDKILKKIINYSSIFFNFLSFHLFFILLYLNFLN